MKFNRIFARSEPFDEVQELLFRVLDEGSCFICECRTYFLDYTTKARPRFICSEECLYDYLDVILAETRAT